jgi:hypothetical protein
VTVTSDGTLYIADTFEQSRPESESCGTITTSAGNGTFGFGGDGIPALLARLNNPYAVGVDSGGNVFVADTWNHRVRKITFSPFTDDPLIPGSSLIKAIHVIELRTMTNARRTARGLPPVQWADPMLTPSASAIKGAHISEIRAALVPVYQAGGLSPPAFTDPVLDVGSIPIKAVHIAELRAAIRALE